VLAAVLVTGSAWLLAAQALVFAAGAGFGLRYSPYGFLYRTLIRPRLGPPRELEPEAPPRFAQAVGLVFAIAGVAGYATGLTWLDMAATATALVAAFLSGVFGFCLGGPGVRQIPVPGGHGLRPRARRRTGLVTHGGTFDYAGGSYLSNVMMCAELSG
jgi:hypothetical protein